jgi:hypothetical protein
VLVREVRGQLEQTGVGVGADGVQAGHGIERVHHAVCRESRCLHGETLPSTTDRK